MVLVLMFVTVRVHYYVLNQIVIFFSFLKDIDVPFQFFFVGQIFIKKKMIIGSRKK